ncbi:MAG: pyridoxal 4-dehydrogenase [Rhodospirillales bacterium 20-64-7]|nr:MAG: pyridoxal 4-dehydrogenase [Rhodospirillales bacterium 20-64-7]HQT75916.1 aldo/keto reductase [Rhodopila sp.]
MEWKTRQIGQTGLMVSEFGLGTATMGGSRIKITRQEGEAIVTAAWDAGVRYFDTAPFYGVGAAEHRVGDALREHNRDDWVLSTKVGRLLRPKTSDAPSSDGRMSPLPFEVVYDYSYDGIMRSVEDSYQRLGLARIDILYVHDIGAYQHGPELNAQHMKVLADSGYKALDELRRSKTVSAIGIGVNEKEVLIDAMEFGDWDAFLLAGRYTLLEQGPLDDLIPKCEARGTTLVIGGPLNSGILAGRDTWNYDTAPPAIMERVKKIAAVCDAHNIPLPAAALQFPLAHPVVSAVIPGPRSAAEFNENLPLMRMKIPAGLWSDLRSEGLLHPNAPVPA